MATIHHVLHVEDDPLIARTLAMSLRYQGFELTTAATVREALARLEEGRFDLVLLDVGLPDGDGVDLCRAIRRRDTELPILMLTARTEEAMAVASIDGGADDYVRKPPGMQELVARMRRLLARRAQRPEPASFGSVSLDLQRRTATIGGVDVHLPKREFDILALLVRARGDVVSREQILAALGNAQESRQEIYDRTIDSHLSHVRRRLRDLGADARITAVYGVGYRMEIAS